MNGNVRHLLLAAVASLGFAPALLAEPTLIIEPEKVILGDPVHIRIEGMEPGKPFTLRAESAGLSGTMIRAEVQFTADPNGKIDLNRNSPDGGTYRGIDPLGMFWSRRPTTEACPPELEADDGESNILFSAVVDGKVVARKMHTRIMVGPGVTRKEVREDRLVATLFLPAGSDVAPGVIIVGDAAGGLDWQERIAGVLASHGFATLALAYVGMDGLPPALENIPLEYFERAHNWFAGQDRVDEQKIGMVGHGKGAELALLMASRDNRIRTVVAYHPSSVVWQSMTPGFAPTSSWTLDGAPFPYVPYIVDATFRQSGKLLDLYEASLDNKEAINRAAIPTEKIDGPVMLISGGEDAVWPSSKMAAGSYLRMTATKHPYEDKHLDYEKAGHAFPNPGYMRLVDDPRGGGKAQDNAKAAAESWIEVVKFLKRGLRLKTKDD